MDKGNNIKHLYLKDTSFAKLMQKRIFNVLLVASYYDAFILEEDGRVEEQIFFEYTSLNLSSPPRVTQVNNLEDAFKELSTKRFDLIIAIPDAEHSQTYEKAKEIKHHYPDIRPRGLPPIGKRRPQWYRLRFQLAGKYRFIIGYHQVARRRNEYRRRYQVGRTDYHVGRRLGTVLLLDTAPSI